MARVLTVAKGGGRHSGRRIEMSGHGPDFSQLYPIRGRGGVPC